MAILKKEFDRFGIRITPFNDNPKDFVAYDLHVSNEYQRPGKTTKEVMPDEYILKPRQCIVVLTEEQLSLPKNIFGVLCAKGSLALRGLTIPNTKVDPFFAGSLKIAVFNSGDQAVIIRPGQAICSVYFLPLGQDIDGDEHPKPPDIRARRANAVVDFFRVHSGEFLWGIAYLIIAFVAGYWGAEYRTLVSGRSLGSEIVSYIKSHFGQIVTWVLTVVVTAGVTWTSAYASTKAAMQRKGGEKDSTDM